MLSFEDTVKQTIKETIRNVFEDDEVVDLLFQYFHKASSKAIDEKIQILTDSLPKILGSGSIIIEDLILETLYSKYNLDFVWKKNYRFADYFIELRKQTTGRAHARAHLL
jgi:hypothetical protein